MSSLDITACLNGDAGSNAEDLLRQIYEASERIPDYAMRRRVQAELRPKLTALQPARALTPMRLFCLPFESLLCRRVSRIWQIGRIPRQVIVPLWTMLQGGKDSDALSFAPVPGAMPSTMTLHWARHPLFDAAASALADVRRQATTDERLRTAGQTVCPQFWDHVAEIEDVIGMRFELMDAMASVDELPDGAIHRKLLMPILDAVQRAAGGSPQRLLLFLLLLAKHPGRMAKALEIARHLDRRSVGALFPEVCRNLVNDVRETVDQLSCLPVDRPLDALLRDFEALTFEVVSLKQAAPEDRDVFDLHERVKHLLRGRFVGAMDALAGQLRWCVENGAPLPANLPASLDVLSRSREMAAAIGLKRLHHHKSVEISGLLTRALGRAGRSLGNTHQEQHGYLDVLMNSACAIESVAGTSHALSVLRSSYAQMGGKDAPSDPGKFLVALVNQKNRQRGIR